MATAARKLRRERPADGGILWHAQVHAFECLGCGDYDEIRKRRQYEDAEFVLRMREMLIVEHTECWQFDDPKMARDARRYRKRKKLRENLAAQRTSWRGRL